MQTELNARLTLIGVTAIALLMSGNVLGQTTGVLPDAQYQLRVGDPEGQSTEQGVLDPGQSKSLGASQTGNSYIPFSGVSAQVSETGLRPKVDVSGTVLFGQQSTLPAGGAFAFASASLNYSFSVVLLDQSRSDLVGILVPIHMRFSLGSFLDSVGNESDFGPTLHMVNAFASLELPDLSLQYQVASSCGPIGYCSDSDSLSNIENLLLVPDEIYRVNLSASGSAIYDSLIAIGEFRAFADPEFEIDSNFAYRDYFSIAYSPNLIAAAVPEPEIYVMLGFGLGMMGWVGRRRKQQAA